MDLSILSSFLKAKTALSSLLITTGLTISHQVLSGTQHLHFCTNSNVTARGSHSVPTDNLTSLLTVV